MMQKLVLEGYIPYRLTTQLMDSQPPAQDDYGKLLQHDQEGARSKEYTCSW